MPPITPQQITIIITTYQRPTALKVVLQALNMQTQLGFDVVVADDGSTQDTTAMLVDFKPHAAYKLQHIWHDDKGFRAAAIRNQAIIASQGDYLIFLDGDSVPPAHFIARHIGLSRSGCFVTGNRILCNQTLTLKIEQQRLSIAIWSKKRWFWQYLAGNINRFLPLFFLPLPAYLRQYKQNWRGAKTCNFAAWKRDLYAINGFDESFQGWGHEDADLATRLLHHGVKRLSGQWASVVFHLWHPDNDRSQAETNLQRLQYRLEHPQSRAEQGLNQYQ